MIVRLFLMFFIAPFLSLWIANWLICHFILRLRQNQLNDLGNLKVEHYNYTYVSGEPYLERNAFDNFLLSLGVGLLTLPFVMVVFCVVCPLFELYILWLLVRELYLVLRPCWFQCC